MNAGMASIDLFGFITIRRLKGILCGVGAYTYTAWPSQCVVIVSRYWFSERPYACRRPEDLRPSHRTSSTRIPSGIKKRPCKAILLSVLAWVRTNEEEVKPNLLIRSINEERKLFSGLNAFACLAMAVLNLNLIFARFTCSSFGTLIYTNVGTFNKLIVLHTLLTSERMSSTSHISAPKNSSGAPNTNILYLDQRYQGRHISYEDGSYCCQFESVQTALGLNIWLLLFE